MLSRQEDHRDGRSQSQPLRLLVRSVTFRTSEFGCRDYFPLWLGQGVAKESVMNVVGATSSQLLNAVVNSAYVSERRTGEAHRYLNPVNSERVVGLNDTLKALMSALFPIAAAGD
jgi:hypothetical protein